MSSDAPSRPSGRTAPRGGGCGNRITYPWPRLRRWVFFGLIAATVALGGGTLLAMIELRALGPLQAASVGLFFLLFTWITLAFWTACAGFCLRAAGRDPLSLRRRGEARPDDTPPVGRTALVMPIHNEHPERVVNGLLATSGSLAATGHAGAFDLFVLSDTTDGAIAGREEAAMAGLRDRLPAGLRVHYRRRASNAGRKPGNIADFCERWGACYDYMVVLDADSLMTGATLVALARIMDANPGAGLLQTVPVPVRQTTVFGRWLQFAGAVHGPMLATGMAFWQGDAANYWGHNAIIRVAAFMDHCGLPRLSGRPPLGGEILSHDFVEAALLRRAGWGVWLVSEHGGSYEEVPAALPEYAKRDRRWAQGNLQHLRLLGATGLHPLSRLHFLLGAFTYIASPLWLMLLALTSLDAVTRETGGLAPQDADGARAAMALLGGTLLLVLAPRVLGVADRVRSAAAGFGGRVHLIASGALDLLLSVALAPVLLVVHTWIILQVLAGRTTPWQAQVREGRLVPWRDALRSTGGMATLAVAWGAALVWLAPALVVWLLPVLVPMALAPLLVRATSSVPTAAALARRGLLRVPAEAGDGDTLDRLRALERVPPAAAGASGGCPQVPPERPRRMPVQGLAAAALAFISRG